MSFDPYGGGWIAGELAPGAPSVELPVTPQFVIFHGTNWTALDSVDTGGQTGLFRGYAAAPGQVAYSVIPAFGGNGFDAAAIACLAPGAASWQYRATCSIRAGGFDLSWSAAGGGRICYLAGYGFPGSYGFPVFKSTSADIGFRPFSSLAFGGRVGALPGFNHDHSTGIYGSVFHEYPPPGVARWGHASVSSHNYPDSTAGQYLVELRAITNFTSSTAHYGDSTTFPSFAMTTAGLVGGITTGNVFQVGCSADAFFGGCLAWGGKSRTGPITPSPTAGAAVSITALEIEPKAILFYTTSDEPQGQANFGVSGIRPGAIGFGVATPEFQWTAVVDGRSPRGAYQSFSHAIAPVVGGGATVCDVDAWTNNGFTLRTIAAPVASAVCGFHALGPARRVWLPQIHRVQRV